jgi:hypothetical protein
MSDRLARSIAIIAILIAAASLALNLFLLWTINNARQAGRQAVEQAITTLDQATTQEFRFTYRLNQTVPFEGNIPVKGDFVFPVKTSVPISTVVPIRMDTGFGLIDLRIPVSTTFPVNMQVPIKIDQTFPVKVDIPLNMDVPVTLRLDQPPFDEAVRGLREWLVQLRDSL